MNKIEVDDQRIVVNDFLLTWLDAFIRDRKAQGMTPGTVKFYHEKLDPFVGYCEALSITRIIQITPPIIRDYLLHLEDKGHNPGGINAHYRTLRTFLYWYERETEPDGWSNPIRKVKAPRLPVEPLDPISKEIFLSLLKTCIPNTINGDRDRAILLFLLDTGVRASEFLAINLEDINQATGDTLIRKGKWSKPRTCFLGNQSRRALRKYLAHRRDDHPALWVSIPRYGTERLTYSGLRSIMRRRAADASVEPPSLHSFRRSFALSMLRSGTDIFTLAKLMGHEGIGVLQRYLKQTDQDTQVAHRRSGPVDHL